MLAMTVHCPVTGDQISAGYTALVGSKPPLTDEPPVASTDPSGRTVRSRWVRG
jgi:hypothetical protein